MARAAGKADRRGGMVLVMWSETTYPLEPLAYAETLPAQADAAWRTHAWQN